MIRPWWLLLSFSFCNVVFHAFLPDLLDQQYSLCTSPSFTLSISSLHWFDIHSRELAFHQGRFSGTLDHDAHIDFRSPPLFEACPKIIENKEKCQNGEEILHSILLFLSYLMKLIPDIISELVAAQIECNTSFNVDEYCHNVIIKYCYSPKNGELKFYSNTEEQKLICNMRFLNEIRYNPSALSLHRWINRDNLQALFIYILKTKPKP